MITAALPTYQNSDIIFLQLESLCAQKDAPEWELIVCEEKGESNYFGIDELKKYKARLKKANCKRIVYLSLDKWVPLGQKWMIIRDHMNSKSIGFMLCASDNYSPSDRIKLTHEALSNGNDWFQVNSGHFYNIKDDKAGLFKTTTSIPALFMAISKDAANKINANEFPKRAVDTWLFKTIDPKKIHCEKSTNGVHTDGFNTISHGRKSTYSGKFTGGLIKPVQDVEKVWNLFPAKIRTKILKLKEQK